MGTPHHWPASRLVRLASGRMTSNRPDIRSRLTTSAGRASAMFLVL